MSGRSLRGALVVALAAGAVAVVAPSAAAESRTAVAASWSGVDSRQPHAVVTDGPIRVGAWRDSDGGHHLSKAYLTFDISGFAGKTVLDVGVRVSEKSAADCSKPRAVQVWTVAPDGQPTWARQPHEQVELVGPPAGRLCVGAPLYDAGSVVEQALAEGRSTVTVAVRVSEEHQGDRAYGRTLDHRSVLEVRHNTAPGVPTAVALRDGSLARPCGVEPLLTASRSLTATAMTSDADGDWPSARFAFWPVADPSARVERTTGTSVGPVQVAVPAEFHAEGVDYAFAVRAEDAHAASDWSATCVYRVDHTAPDVPAVSSTVYLRDVSYPGTGGVGVAGDFVLTADAPDVVRFEYSSVGVPPRSVPAVDGTAVLTVVPDRDGSDYLQVVSIDAAGNRSDATYYDYWVRDTRPVIEAPRGIYGEPFPVTFTAQQQDADTVHYTVDGVTTSVPLVDGVATVELVIAAPPGPVLTAWTTAGGTASQPAALDFGGPVEET